MKNNKKGFTLVELLAVIVILAILMVSAGAAVMSTLNNARVNTFKNEALSAISVADNLYTEISMNPTDSNMYLKNSNDNNYKGMCVTLNGLVQSGYLNKDLQDGATRGVVLIEVPFDGGATKRTIWITNGTYAITGYEQGKISGLRYKQANNAQLNTNYYGLTKNVTKNGVSVQVTYKAVKDEKTAGVVTDITKADQIIELAHGIKATAAGIGSCKATGALNQTCTASGNSANSAGYKNTSTNRVISKFYAAPETPNGGTGLNYTNIVCINSSLSK